MDSKNKIIIMQKGVINKLIKNTQKMLDTNEEKQPYDKIKCIICGRNYIRKNRSLHVKTKRHKLKMYELDEKIFDILQSQLN